MNILEQQVAITPKESRTTRGRGRLYGSVLDTIGDKPCVRVNKLAPDHVRLYVKAEFFNPAGSVILCKLPDTGERYLSSPLFEGIAEDMTEEESALSLSTRTFRCNPPSVNRP